MVFRKRGTPQIEKKFTQRPKTFIERRIVSNAINLLWPTGHVGMFLGTFSIWEFVSLMHCRNYSFGSSLILQLNKCGDHPNQRENFH